MQVFLIPDLDGPVTGGTLFNRMVIACLERANVACRVCPTVAARAELSHAGLDDVFWVDSLFLDLLPDLAHRQRRHARLGLLLHYLPSLVTSVVRRGPALTSWELSRPETEALSAADLVLVTGGYMREVVERALERGAVLHPRVLVVEPGRLAAGPVELPQPPVRAVLVANLLPGKGILPFLRSLAEQTLASDPYQLDIVGGADLDPDYARACERAADDGRLHGRVRRLGGRSPEATVRYMASCNLLVSASLMESYGMALAEARCLGLPIVAQRGGNVEALVSGRAGGEVVPDSSALARAFLAVCRAPLELQRRKAAALADPLPPRPWTAVAAEFLEGLKVMVAARSHSVTKGDDVAS
jgi:glycosyltransferase involved in cell wall biosynthesis